MTDSGIVDHMWLHGLHVGLIGGHREASALVIGHHQDLTLIDSLQEVAAGLHLLPADVLLGDPPLVITYLRHDGLRDADDLLLHTREYHFTGLILKIRYG